MNLKHYRTVFLVINILSLILFLPTKSFSSNYTQTYTFHTKIDNFEVSHKLYVSVPQSLYNYYQRQNHNTFNIGDISKFVTPNIFRSIAEDIQNVTGNIPHSDEIFANAVLEIVQQIPYNKSNVKFPAETIVDNAGDCDLLSLLAASIMKAGGLDVVLLFYEGSPVSHMNVGVHLLADPVHHAIEMEPTYYEYDNKKYFSAETTGKNYWKVGDQPHPYINTEPEIISLKNLTETSSVEISSNLDNPLIPSATSLSLMPESLQVMGEETNITISGSISPRFPKQQVTVNIDHESYPSYIYKTVTDQLGNYLLTLNFNNTGTYIIQTSWNGAKNYACSDSNFLTINIGLDQLLDKFEVNGTLRVGQEVIQTPELNYLGYTILNHQQIKKILEKNFTGTDILLSSEFIILGNGEPLLTEQKITIPSYEVTILRRRDVITKIIPEQTIVIPNYRQKMDNHIEFTLHQNGEDCSVSVRLMDSSDVAQIIDKSDSTYINASKYVEENIWYNIEANIYENQTIVKLLDENSTRLTETAPIDHTNSTHEFKILMKYDPDSIIVFKDLKAENLDQPAQLVEENKPPVDVTQTQPIEIPEPEEPTAPELSKPEKPTAPELSEPKEPNQEFASPTTITIIGLVSLTTLAIIIFFMVRELKYTEK